MNNNRRRELKDVTILIDKAHSLLMEAQEELDRIAGEEEESYDNLPEGLQDSERGQQIEENYENLFEWSNDLENNRDELSDIIDKLQELGEFDIYQ